MTETMVKVLDLLRRAHLERDLTGGYRAVWHLEDELGIKLAGCGVPDGDNAIEQLVKLGLIEEVADLGCRFRIVVRDGAE